MRSVFLLVFLPWTLLLGIPPVSIAQQAPEGSIRYFLQPSLPLQPTGSVQKFLIDTGTRHIGQDTLFQVLTASGEPQAYYRHLIREVCFDGQCRLLNVFLHWNVTGRYLGFELPAGEFLSKTEHEPFTTREYRDLNTLLSDSLSPLGMLTYKELVPNADTSGRALDGVTSATSQEALRYVVKGAVYTTYTMWHEVYGPARQEVMRRTEEALTPALAQRLLHSPDMSDRYWTLSRLNKIPLTSEVRAELLALINDDNYSLAERTLHAIPGTYLGDEQLQSGLAALIGTSSYSLKNLILRKLTEAPSLHRSVTSGVRGLLKNLNGEALKSAFGVLRAFGVADKQTLDTIRELQQSPNSYIANMASAYLRSVAATDR